MDVRDSTGSMERHHTALAGQHLALELAKARLIKGALLHILGREAHFQAVWRAHQDLALLAQQNAEGLGINIYFAHVLGQPLQGDIGRHNGRRNIIGVIDGA